MGEHHRAESVPVPADWSARWISPVEVEGSPPAQRPAYHLAGQFTLGAAVDAAVLYATAQGVYEVFLNGHRVGDAELTPGFTSYRSRLQVQRFEVTSLVQSGDNALGALLSDGWWRGQHGVIRSLNAYGDTTAFLAELHLTLETGELVVVGTDATWQSTPSHVLAADLIAGEVHDLRRRVTGWAEAGTDRTGWSPVLISDDDGDDRQGALCSTIGEPVRRVGELPAASVVQLAPGHHIVDFAQNSNGWIRLTDLGPAGTTLRIRYAEALDPDTGDVTQDHIATALGGRDLGLAFQTDIVTSAGDGSVFEPRHSTKGFRYVSVEGFPGTLEPASVTSIVVHTDLARVGDFRCSDERVNQLHDVAVWSFRGNACEIPTDCPTRERSGWTGDWQLYVDTAAYLFEVTDWSVKWLLDLAADQLPDGRVTSIVPDPNPHARWWSTSHGSSGWGDAAVHVPYELYRSTGRTDFLAAQFESMSRWVEFAADTAASGRHPSRQERYGDPQPHERFIWDTGWHFGEWLEPGVDMDTVFAGLRTADHAPTATAFLHRSARQLSEIAELLGETESAERYAVLAAATAAAWRTEFIDAAGHVTPTTQANVVRALAFGLIPEQLIETAVDDLVGLVRAADNHLATGFLATPFLLPVLADHGHLDLAYELLVQQTEPSWLCMINRGATTVWEDWDGLSADGTPKHSLNHYSKGAVISFLHRYTAGLQLLEPGYRRFRVAPRPGGGITSAETSHETPFGPIEITWRIEMDAAGATSTTALAGSIDVVVPECTEADLVLPDGSAYDLGPGTHHHTWVTSPVA